MVQMGGGGFSLCVSNSENCKQTDHIDCKGSKLHGVQVDGNILDPHESAI
jgi:hypothetical protein